MGKLEIKSNVNGKVLHIVFSHSNEGREEIIPHDNFIQCAALDLKKGTTFRPHKHIYKPGPEMIIAQESWVVIKGSVMCVFYDIDDKILQTVRLEAGDASFTLGGGHTYRLLEDSIVYEYKIGPYTGQENDKEFI